MSFHRLRSLAFYVTKLLLFRPFLLLTLELKRRRVHSILSERNGGVEIAVLISAAAHSIDAAKAIVNLCDSLFSLGIAVEVSIIQPPSSSHLHDPRLQELLADSDDRAHTSTGSTSRAPSSSSRSPPCTPTALSPPAASRNSTPSCACCAGWELTSPCEA